MKYIFENEVVVATSTGSYKEIDWGPYQFPQIYLIDDILYLSFHQELDSITAYGKEQALYLSKDLGETWEKTTLKGGTAINNGEFILPKLYPSIPTDMLSLPSPIHTVKIYGRNRYIYNQNGFDKALSQWHVLRGQINNLVIDSPIVHAPLFCRYITEDLLPTNFFLRFYLDPSSNVWALQQRFLNDNPYNNHALFFKSTDNGHSFTHHSTIYYDKSYNKLGPSIDRMGFGEQSLTFIDKNTAFSLLRTTDGYGNTPMYISWSYDGATTWSKPEYFDEIGVWPEVISLNNGVHIAGYGRPGLYIKGLYNNIWEEDKTTIVPPLDSQQDTCSYCGMVPINDDTFLLAYSDFNHINEDRNSCKAIKVKRIKVTI